MAGVSVGLVGVNVGLAGLIPARCCPFSADQVSGDIRARTRFALCALAGAEKFESVPCQEAVLGSGSAILQPGNLC